MTRFLKTGTSLFLALVLALAPISASAASFDEMLVQLRQEIFDPNAPEFFAPITVPSAEARPAPSTGLTPPQIGDSMPFFAYERAVEGFDESELFVEVTFVQQTEYVNIWADDPELEFPPEALARLDAIVGDVTGSFGEFAGVVVRTPNPKMPFVGDIHGDGRVNLVMYEMADRENWGGYFASIYFQNDLGDGEPNEPMAIVTGNTDWFDYDPETLFNIIAHELQHMLFFMHFQVYLEAVPELVEDLDFDISSMLWFNESLSELAGRYWGIRGTSIDLQRRILPSALNSYENPGRPGAIGDFLNFNNSRKSYGMSQFNAVFKHRTLAADPTAGSYYTRAIYNYFARLVPPAHTEEEFLANIETLRGMTMPEIIGDALYYAGLTGSTGARGEDALGLLYFLFMENHAADGGIIHTPEGQFQTRPFVDNHYSADNLWGLRQTYGTDRLVFRSSYHEGNDLSIYEAPPVLSSGDNFQLRAYNAPEGFNGTLESLFMLDKPSGAGNTINIRVDDHSPAGQGHTIWYLVAPNDAPGAISSNANRTLGANGATVIKISSGSDYTFATNGQDIYLFAVTFLRNVEAAVNFSWED